MMMVQVAVSDKQFLKSMIPHHAAAVLMVKEAKLTDPEIINWASRLSQANKQR